MEITREVIQFSVKAIPFGTFEPFISGDEFSIKKYYEHLFADLEITGKISVYREADHYGSGYASYISAFLFPCDGSSRQEFPEYFETTGVLLYLSRLAPIAVYGASARSQNKENTGSSSGFIELENLYKSPPGDWGHSLSLIRETLAANRIVIPPKEKLTCPAPKGMVIPTVFDPPYHAFDTLFYWKD